MADQPERGAPRRSEGPRPEQPGERSAEAPPQLRGPKSLERLRDRIQTAASEIVRLREDNAAFADRLSNMESRLERESSGAIRLGEDPEVLRGKVAGFIEDIDRYLEGERNT